MTDDARRPHPTARPRSWWQSLPGILTATAALLSAVAGLIVAISQSRGSETQHNTAPATEAASPSNGRAQTPAGPQVQRASGTVTTLPPTSDVRLAGGRLVLRVLTATVEPFNQAMRVLRLRIRFTNNGETFERDYYWTFRLLVDGVPSAPEDRGYNQIEAHSAKELEYAFRVPSSSGRVTLRISNSAGEEAELPFDLP